MKPGLLILAAIVAFQVSGCSSFSRKLDASRAKAVKKVAVLSVEVQFEMPRNSLGLGKLGELKDGPTSESPELQGMAKDITVTLTKELSQKTRWQVLSFENVVNNRSYKAKVGDVMSGAHAISMSPKDTEIIVPQGLLGNAPLRGLSHDERVRLARELGADAYAELIVIDTIEQGFSIKNLTGDAAFSHKGRANLIVRGLENDEPIWQIQNVDGELSANSSDLPESLTKMQKLAKTGRDAAVSAVQKMMADYDRP